MDKTSDDNQPTDDELEPSDAPHLDDDGALEPEEAPHSNDSDEPSDSSEEKTTAKKASGSGRKKTKRKKKSSKKSATSKSSSSAASKQGGNRAGVNKKTSDSSGYVIGLVGLAAGLGIGWFAHQNTTQGAATPDPATAAASAAPAGSAAKGVAPACKQWSDAVCKGAGASSDACTKAKSVNSLLGAQACAGALKEVPATVAKAKKARKSCDELVGKLCKALGDKTETCKMVKEKTPQFPASRCKQMLGSFPQVLKSLKQMEARNAPIAADVAAKQAAGDGPSYGPADAKVTLVEYSDFECPFCSRAAKTLSELKKRYGKVVRFVFRQYPLPMHKNAKLAAAASLAAHDQGKFWPLHDMMFENFRKLDRASIEKYAKEVGLDLKKFKKALDDKSFDEAVAADMKLGGAIQVSGTPTMIVGTKRVKAPTDVKAISAMIDEQLKAAGVPIPPEPAAK